MNVTKKILITGGPGSGKTSLINELERKSFNCENEIIRRLTIEGKKKGTDQAFLKDPLKFTKKLIELRTKQFNKEQTSLITFYDRGVHETLAYLNYIGLKYSNELNRKCRTIKYDMVFILPPWKKIYIQDNCRYETFDQAKKIHKEIVKIYEYFNMRIIFLKKDSIENRVKEILIHVKQ